MYKVLLILILCLPLEIHSRTDDKNKSEKLLQFKMEQNCVHNAVNRQKWAIALDCSKKSLAIAESLFKSNHPSIATLTRDYGLMLEKAGQPHKSIEILRAAVSKFEAIYGRESPKLSEHLIALGDVMTTSRITYYDEAANVYSRALRLIKESDDFEALAYANTAEISFRRLAKRHNAQGFNSNVIEDIGKEAYEIFLSHLGKKDLKTAHLAFDLGKFLFRRIGKRQEGIEFFKKGLENNEVNPYARAFLSKTYTEQGKLELARKYSNKESVFRPLYVPIPLYPERAQRFAEEGFAVIQMTITNTGATKDLLVVDENPKNWRFGHAALEAAKNLKYSPKLISGIATEVPHVLYKFNFLMAKRPYDEKPNSPPIWKQKNLRRKAQVNKKFVWHLNWAAKDSDNDKLSYDIVSGPSWLSMTNTRRAKIEGIPTTQDIGKNKFVATVTDGIHEEVLVTLEILVSPAVPPQNLSSVPMIL